MCIVRPEDELVINEDEFLRNGKMNECIFQIRSHQCVRVRLFSVLFDSIWKSLHFVERAPIVSAFELQLSSCSKRTEATSSESPTYRPLASAK